MSGTTIIPRNDEGFNGYITSTTTALLVSSVVPPVISTWERLGLTLIQKDQWVLYRDNWVIIYEKYTDKAKRTSAVTKDKNDLKAAFIVFATPLLTGISVRPELTNEDRVTFNLAAADTTPTARPVIDVKPDVTLRAKDGMRVQVECRLEHDQSRPSKHKDCDVVEYRHWFSEKATPPDPANPTPPVAAAVVKTIGESGKAKFIIQFAEADAGKVLNLEARWKNSKENQKSGPWSNPAQVMVGW